MARTASALGSRRYFCSISGGSGSGSSSAWGKSCRMQREIAAGQSLGLGVNGLKGRGLDLFSSTHLQVDHLAAQRPTGHDALKIVFLPQLQFLGGVGVIEPCDLQTGYIVPGGDALHSPTRCSAPCPPALCEHLGLPRIPAPTDYCNEWLESRWHRG